MCPPADLHGDPTRASTCCHTTIDDDDDDEERESQGKHTAHHAAWGGSVPDFYFGSPKKTPLADPEAKTKKHRRGCPGGADAKAQERCECSCVLARARMWDIHNLPDASVSSPRMGSRPADCAFLTRVCETKTSVPSFHKSHPVFLFTNGTHAA